MRRALLGLAIGLLVGCPKPPNKLAIPLGDEGWWCPPATSAGDCARTQNACDDMQVDAQKCVPQEKAHCYTAIPNSTGSPAATCVSTAKACEAKRTEGMSLARDVSSCAKME